MPGDGGRDVAGILEGASNGSIKFMYLLGADEIDTSRLGSAFVVYQGHHGDAGANRADVILPGAAYTEKNATYVNTEGRVQLGRLAVYPPGNAREDWTIVRALSDAVGHKLSYDNLRQLRARMIEINSNFLNVDLAMPAAWEDFGTTSKMDSIAFDTGHVNFYMTDPISRASETMAHCTKTFLCADKRKTGTNG